MLDIVPIPEPASDTDNAIPAELKVAPTFVDALTTTAQVLDEPLHAPDQPTNESPDAGAAVRTTLVPLSKSVVHCDPQLIPAGLLVMVPEPFFATLSGYVFVVVGELG